MKVTPPVVPPTPPAPSAPQMGPLPPKDVRYAAMEHGLGSAVAETGQKVVKHSSVGAAAPVARVGSTDPAILQQELQFLGDMSQLALLYGQFDGQCISPYPGQANPNLSAEISALTAKVQAEYAAFPQGDPVAGFPTMASVMACVNSGDSSGFVNLFAGDPNGVLMYSVFGVGNPPGWIGNLDSLQLSGCTPQQQGQIAMNVYMMQMSAMAFQPAAYQEQLDTNFWGQPAGQSMSNNFASLMYSALWLQDGGGGKGTPLPNGQQFGQDLINLGYMMGTVWAGLAKTSTGNFPNFAGQGGAYMNFLNLLTYPPSQGGVGLSSPTVPSNYTPVWPSGWLNTPNQSIAYFISQVFEPMYHS